MELFLPDLMYCDRKKTIDLLSILVNDLVTEYSLKQSNGSKIDTGIEGGLSTPLGKIVSRYKGENSRSVEKEGIVKLPTAALFTDLHTVLNSEQKVQRLIGFDDAIWKQLQVGEFVEVDGTFSQSPVETAFSSLVDFIEQFKGMFAGQAGTEQMTMIANILQPKTATMIIKPYNEIQTSFITSINLDTENLLTERYEIEGELTVFGRVRRITPVGGKVDLIKFLPGKLKMKEQEMMKMFSQFTKAEEQGISFSNLSEVNEKSFYMEGPVVEISPIAIYQNS
ncbi:hypothetical protein E0485_05865 [Paenibacillus albiflavus]|uniref:Uncharacterized protein n=1 Tax=Paenibacillus albiflavus TaxID=2545760 RepID=A0A4R4EI66_9BACL|nr:hypothetical protein [Paenibacillus albiflavus]TCZ79387.1 hypothetical protein E0485_05865 [Paenibacillus albiflavus]